MNTKYFTMAILAIALLGSSCSKSDDTTPSPTPAPNNSNGAITYNDGNAVVVDSANAVLYSITPMGGVMQREIDVYAYKGGKLVLEFHFQPKTGNQPVAQDFNSAWLTYLTNNGTSFPSDYYHCVSGNFNLTTCDTIANKLVGTFSFIGNNGTANKSITAGTININSIKRQ